MAGQRFIVTEGFLLTLDSCEVSDRGQETNKEKCKFCALTSFSSLLAQPLLLAPKTTVADKLHHGGSSPFPRPRMTVLHIPGAITAENLPEEKTRSSLETTPSISTFQG